MASNEPLSFLSYEHIRTDDEIRTLALFGGSDQDPIRVQLFHQKLSAPNNPWIALSYVWGPPKPSFTIFCNDNVFEVGESLWQALLYLRKLEVGSSTDTFKCFWIDAICMNQQDDSEKARQIPLMSSIYQAATKVIVWLGLPSQDSSLAMAALQEWAALATAGEGEKRNMRKARWRVAFEQQSQQDNQFHRKANAVAALSSRTWFARAWCFQEAIFASGDSTLMCGTDSASVSDLMMAAEGMIAAGYSFWLFGSNPNAVSIVRWRSVYNDKRFADTRTWHLSHLMEQTEYQNATDPRDKIYSILALVSSTSPEARKFVKGHCPIRYDPPASRVYEYFTRLILWQDWNLRVLTQCYRGQSNKAADLPSWVPDWRVRNHLQPLCKFEDTTGEPFKGDSNPRKESFHVGRGLPTSLRCLHAKGWSYGRIQEVHDINGSLPGFDDQGFVPGNLNWVRNLHAHLQIESKTRELHMNFDSVVEFMYALSGGNLPGIWHKLSWDHSRSTFPAHFRFEWTKQRWLEGDGTMWNVWRKGFQVDEGWRDKPSNKTEGQHSEERTSAYIIDVYEKMLGAHKSLLRKAWQWDNDLDDRLDIRYKGTRREYYQNPKTQAQMAAEVLRYIKQTMRHRVFIILDNGAMEDIVHSC
ncbi:hypothetical protein S40285_07122 [Stachybotrys chlorohalonatus IBT 40285]|uniref:Heterokaryon incompatibility domain-containing protein n=1 Tax=Stachybotrys chlorohalonatus (strain IBT 40285) TaxID=1283841 RepID=A0A084QID0_STAC4|nr:hypothetical protein S40285_07122 [Stachybotrys chlorohalonata IBT 40285]